MTLAISGFSPNGGGSLAVERAIAKVPGVTWVYVNSTTEMAYLQYDPDVLVPARVVAAVDRTGLKASEVRRR